MRESPKTWQKAVMFGSSIATTLAALVGGGYFLGHYLDGLWKTRPWLTLILMISGLVLGGVYLVMTLKEFGAFDDEK